MQNPARGTQKFASALAIALELPMGCFASPPPPAPPAPVRVVAPADPANLAGTLVEDGHPIDDTDIGVVAARDFSTMFRVRALRTHTHRGRFALAHVPPGTWDVVIVGRGFARAVVIGVAVAADRATELGAIAVHRGRRIEGTVVTGGQPVARATVHLEQGPIVEHLDPWTELARGNATTTTDLAGQFAFEDVTSANLSGPHLDLWAEAPGALISQTTRVALDARPTQLVLEEAGSIEGVILGSTRPVGARSRSGLYFADTDARGRFRFPRLPSGTYTVELVPGRGDDVYHRPLASTTVAPQTTSHVTIDAR